MEEYSTDTSPRSTPTIDVSAQARAWLDHIPAHKRGTVANWFHYAVRNGAQTPHTVCSAVGQTIHRRLEWSSDLTSRQVLQGVLEVLRTHQAEALAYAQSVLDYERLPYQDRQKVKAQRSLQYLKGSMAGKPATEAQHGLLRRLGYAGALPDDRAEASALIDRLMHQEGGGR